MQYDALLSDAASYAGRLAVLALVPLLASLSRLHDVAAIATRSGFHVDLQFGIPHPVTGLWAFVEPPSSGSGVDVHLPTFLDAGFALNAALWGFVALILLGLLQAGYVGSIDQYIETGRYDFLGNVGRYGLRMIAFQGAVLVGALGLVVPLLVSPILFLVILPVLLALAYLLYLVPFLVVVEDRPLLDAVDRSTSLATDGGDPLFFFVLYAILVAGASVPLSIVTNAGFLGVLVAAIVSSGIGLFFTVFTVLFVRELVSADVDGDGNRDDGEGDDWGGDGGWSGSGDEGWNSDATETTGSPSGSPSSPERR